MTQASDPRLPTSADALAALADWFRGEAKGAALAAELEKAVLHALEPALEAFRAGERSEDLLRRVRQHNASDADYRRYAKNAEAFTMAAFFLSDYAALTPPEPAENGDKELLSTPKTGSAG